MALLFQRFQPVIDVAGKALDEHQGSDLLRGGGVVVLIVEQHAQFAERVVAVGGDRRGQRLHFSQRRSFVERLAPFHLLHQEAAWHRGVVFSVDRHAVQFAEVRGSGQRVFQAPVRFDS